MSTDPAWNVPKETTRMNTITADLALEREIRQVLIDLELISHGSISAYNSSGGGHGENEHAIPPGENRPPHLYWRECFSDTNDETHRRTLLKAAQAELSTLRRRPKPTTEAQIMSDKEIMEERILREGSGWTASEVARTFRCSIGFVRKTRLHNARDTETGAALLDLTMSDRQVMVLRLASVEKLSQKQIAERMGISQQRVCQLLRVRRPREMAA